MTTIYLTVAQTQFQFNTTGDQQYRVKRTIRTDKDGSLYIIFRGSKYHVRERKLYTATVWEAMD